MSSAVIDIGSGSVRLLLGGKKTTVMTKLGEGLNAEGVLSETAIIRTVSAIKDLAMTARLAGAEVHAFATEAVRVASNRGEFLSAVSAECAVDVEIISGYEEAEVALLGACPDGDATVIDIGGASVEIVCGSRGNISYVKSLPLGMVRLTEQSDGAPDLIRAYSVRGLSNYGKVEVLGKAIGVGGTFTSLSAMAQGLEKYDSEKVQGYYLDKETVAGIREKLIEAETPEKIMEIYPSLPPLRAELIKAGAIFVGELFDYLGIDGVTVSEADNLDGYLRYKGLN
ncbi:MAG: hypothetical protein IJX05_01600 [Clostridia bacterium]|nr:hypothetical protein [Clostridia bacterium]